MEQTHASFEVFHNKIDLDLLQWTFCLSSRSSSF